MKTHIQDWLGTRIGVIIDLSPENFGMHTKDGTLLAKLLYSYGAIPQQILNNIKGSKNVNDCYNNLKVLKPWLEYLEVPVKDEVLYEVASGQGSAALHLFYAVYLSLKHKDDLKYFSIQKERRYSNEQCKREIKVDRVFEKDVLASQSEYESEIALPLIEKQYMIERHKMKCNEILQKIRAVRENYAKTVTETKTELGPIYSRHASSKKLTRQELEIENTENDIKQFTAKNLSTMPDLSYQELLDLQNQTQKISLKLVPDFKQARGYIKFLKQKTTKGIITQKFQEDMQSLLIDNMWNNLKSKQDDNFEEIVCQNLLKQSQYEKQMCTKLCLIRHQKDLLVKHRQKIDSLNISNIIQKEYEDNINYKMEAVAEDAFDAEFERQRLLELHKRVYVEKVRLKFQERLEEAKSILDKFIDIAVRISEFREVFTCEVPKHIMKDLKELFFKDLPVFDILEDVAKLYITPAYGCVLEKEKKQFGNEIYGEQEQEFGETDCEQVYDEVDKEECAENDDDDSAKTAEFIRQEVLNECDFNDYLFLLGPWLTEILLPDEIETEVSQTVLGYIVHKLLACKYPAVKVPVPVGIRPMNIRGVVQGSSDEGAFAMLSEILALRKVLVIRVDDAVNFILRAYKEESSGLGDLDIAFQQATKMALKGKSGTERTKEHSRKEQLIQKESIIQKSPSVEEPLIKEVSTQTPRKIPNDDPSMSSIAEIGKSAFESLGMGDPIPDLIVISAIMAYVASLQDQYEGWVLWNYPVMFSQAVKLESALTGYEFMSTDDEMDTIEGIEGFGYRSTYLNPHWQDDFADKRLSRLVPKPEGNTAPAKADSYFTSIVKLRKKNDSMRRNQQLQGPGQDCIEKLYFGQDILHIFEFTSITFQDVKEIAKVVLGETSLYGECDTELNQKTSVEVFGSGVLELNEKYNASKKKMDKEFRKASNEIPKISKEGSEAVLQSQPLDERSEDVSAGEREKAKKGSQYILKDKVPGEPGWEWAAGDQTEEIQMTLAGFWENLEAVFVEDFKYIFFCLRVHRGNTVKLKSFLKKALQDYLRREDIKQNILNDFQLKFNDIDDDLRPDCDVKYELHVRVSELEEVLFEIADERRDKSEKYRIKFINDNWVADEMANLVNLYIRALQLEADRCIDTCQFINDYYLSLQQKIPQEIVLQKIYAPTILMERRSHSMLPITSRSWLANNPFLPSRSAMFKPSKASLSRKGKDKGPPGTRSQTPCCSLQHEVATLPEGAEAMVDIMVNLSFPPDATTPFHKFFLETAEDLRKNIKSAIETCISETRKGGSTTQVGGGKERKKTAEARTEASSQATEEWVAALESELSRFLYRIRLIQVRGTQDFNEFISEILDTLTAISDEIGEIYNREVGSISECCKVFRCAIEEEVAVQPRLELHVDEFIINQGVLLFRDSSVEFMHLSASSYSQNEFTIEQLTFMFKKLHYIAPEGEIIRRAFLYILEDLRVMKSEDGRPRLLPDLWDDLNPNDLPFIFDRVYQRIEIVNWRDFIVYALDLPMPTDVEILSMLSNFRSYDQSGTELIHFKDFIRVEFWFESYNTRFNSGDVKEFLFKMYRVNEEYVNYTALLLSFCKDEDPSVGFVKALTLSVGKRILVDDLISEEGEQDEVIEGDDNVTESLNSVKSTLRTKGRSKDKRFAKYPCDCKIQSQYPSVSQLSEEAGESYGLYVDYGDSSETLCTSDIPRDVIKKVLLASYPSLPQMSILLQCKKSFERNVNDMINCLSTDGTTVKISKLLKHKFIFRVLSSTNKFKRVDMQNIVKSIVDERLGNLGTSCSLSWS